MNTWTVQQSLHCLTESVPMAVTVAAAAHIQRHGIGGAQWMSRIAFIIAASSSS